MTNSLHDGPFRPDLASDFAPLREVLQRAGYTEASVREALGGRNELTVDMPVVLHRTEEPSAFNTLVRLFALHLTQSEESVQAAIIPVGLGELLAVGMIERIPGGIRATARLVPWREFFLLNDFLPSEGEPLPSDFVMSGASSSSLSLATLTVRRKVARVLDLGTGSGVQALLAAAHAESVVATDASPRALNFTAMNARLNGIGNVTVREGSFFEPVRGERFDLIVSNPPFIIAPRSKLLFQGAGVAGDAVSERVVREAPAHLAEGGFAISLVSWVDGGDAEWAARPREWLEGAGCDAWVLRVSDETPLEYAANALHQTEPLRSERYAATLDAWLDYYREHAISRLAIGAVILRKRASAANWVRCDVIPTKAACDASVQIQRIFAAEDLLVETERGDCLLDLRVVLHPDHVLEQELAVQCDAWTITSAVLSATRGVRFQAALDSRVVAFLALCDGRRTVREAISVMAKDFEMDTASAEAGGLPIVHGLLRAGMLVACD